ncbi:CIA30 domain-containing protein [Mycena sanguinolenta]|uniref:CIA30 domain-containing protein n=1 Tax=Mycena sanguinolenta TaxID=230812 RepID=A0A8H6Z9V7_9AGAR|nr:CIA30 domain-containing protein [Mycena sanguinolenta]
MSRWSKFWRRTGRAFQDQSRRIINMEGAELPNRGPRLLYSFNTPEQASEVVLGCDADVGGFSSVNFALDTTSESERIGRPTAKFFGNLRLDVRPELVGRINSGYAAFRTPVRTTLFGKITDNVYFHDYLALRVRAAGDPVLHKSYVVNVQTVDGMSHKTVWQQPLDIRRQDNDWETIYLPFANFRVFTIGEPSPYHEPIDRENILTIGVGVLGGNHHASGPYELGLDSIWVANEPDLVEDSPGPNTYVSDSENVDSYPTDPKKTP